MKTISAIHIDEDILIHKEEIRSKLNSYLAYMGVVAHMSPFLFMYGLPIDGFFAYLKHKLEENILRKSAGAEVNFAIAVVEFHDLAIPISLLKTEDRGKICAAFADTDYPHWAIEQYNWFSDSNLGSDYLQAMGLEIIKEGVGEQVVECDEDSFETHLKKLSQVGRAWKRNQDLFMQEELLNFCNPIVSHINSTQTQTLHKINRTNFEYYVKKETGNLVPVQGEYPKPENIYTTFNSLLMKAFLPPPLWINIRQPFLGYAMFSVHPTEIYWVNSFFLRDEETYKRALGNYFLLRALKYAYDHHLPRLNLGLDVFDYKAVWKPKHSFRPGFKILPDSPLSF